MFFNELAHTFGNFDAVCVAGIGVSAVTNYGRGKTVRNIFFCNIKGCALNKILCICSCRCGTGLAYNQSEVFFGFVFSYACVYTCSLKSFCGTNAAVYLFHF